MDELPFNTIVIDSDTVQRRISVEDFLALPLTERVGYILSKSLRFFKDFDEIDTRSALIRLRAVSARRGGG
jgi:hypothetical protein